LFCFSLNAQDFHNTYWQFAQVEVNPAFTGAFLGNLRVNAIGRNQGTGVANGSNIDMDMGRNSFDDLSIALDGSLPFGLKDTDWISLGLNISKSTAGAGGFQRNFAGLSAAYHLSMNKDQTSVFTLGVRYGSYNTSLANKVNFIDPFGLQGNGTSSDITGLNVEEASETGANDFMVGVMYTTPVGDNADLRIGISSDHLLNPRLSNGVLDTSTMIRTNPENLERRLNVFAQYYVSLTDRMVFNPTVLYMTTANGSELLVQSLFSYLFNAEKDIVLNFGIGVRPSSSMDIPLFLGADWKDWKFGLSYDTNVSGLTQANGTFGALELGVSRVISWDKKATVKPKYVCPRL